MKAAQERCTACGRDHTPYIQTCFPEAGGFRESAVEAQAPTTQAKGASLTESVEQYKVFAGYFC